MKKNIAKKNSYNYCNLFFSFLFLSSVAVSSYTQAPATMQQARLRLTLLLSLVIVIVIVSYSVAGPVSASGWKYLTHDWTLGSVNLYSDLAKEIHEAQRRCEKKMWFAPPNAGMGSDIHVCMCMCTNVSNKCMSGSSLCLYSSQHYIYVDILQ